MLLKWLKTFILKAFNYNNDALATQNFLVHLWSKFLANVNQMWDIEEKVDRTCLLFSTNNSSCNRFTVYRVLSTHWEIPSGCLLWYTILKNAKSLFKNRKINIQFPKIWIKISIFFFYLRIKITSGIYQRYIRFVFSLLRDMGLILWQTYETDIALFSSDALLN